MAQCCTGGGWKTGKNWWGCPEKKTNCFPDVSRVSQYPRAKDELKTSPAGLKMGPTYLEPRFYGAQNELAQEPKMGLTSASFMVRKSQHPLHNKCSCTMHRIWTCWIPLALCIVDGSDHIEWAVSVAKQLKWAKTWVVMVCHGWSWW